MSDNLEIQMPPRAGTGLLQKGVLLVRICIEEEKRRRSNTSGIRYSLVTIPDSPLTASEKATPTYSYSAIHFRRSSHEEFAEENAIIQAVPPKRKKPDLHAAILSFPARLLTYVRQKYDGNGAVAYTRAGVSRQIYSRIISWDDETADKKTVLKFCIGLQLDMTEAELLMKSAGYAFSETIPLDCAFTYAIKNKMWNILDVNEMLVQNHLPDLNIKF